MTGAIQQRLPSNLQTLAGPASAGIRQLAERAAPELLARLHRARDILGRLELVRSRLRVGGVVWTGMA